MEFKFHCYLLAGSYLSFCDSVSSYKLTCHTCCIPGIWLWKRPAWAVLSTLDIWGNWVTGGITSLSGIFYLSGELGLEPREPIFLTITLSHLLYVYRSRAAKWKTQGGHSHWILASGAPGVVQSITWGQIQHPHRAQKELTPPGSDPWLALRFL